MLRAGIWGVVLVVVMTALGCSGPTPNPTQTVTPPAPAAPTAEGKPAAAEGAGIAWNYDYADGMKQAKEAGKPVMVDVFATWCGPCKTLDKEVFSRPDVIEASKAFVTIRVDGDKSPELTGKLKVDAYPTVVFLTPDGKEIGRSLGAVPYQNMLDSMSQAKEKVASAK